MASQCATLLLASPRPERAFTPLPHPQVHTQLGQGAKKPPGPILLPSPWHISSSQARLGCRQGAAGSSRDMRMQGPVLGYQETPRAWQPQNDWTGGCHVNHCQLWLHTWSRICSPLHWLCRHGGRGRRGGGPRVTQQEHFNDLSSSCKTPLEQHCPVLHQHPRHLSRK